MRKHILFYLPVALLLTPVQPVFADAGPAIADMEGDLNDLFDNYREEQRRARAEAEERALSVEPDIPAPNVWSETGKPVSVEFVYIYEDMTTNLRREAERNGQSYIKPEFENFYNIVLPAMSPEEIQRYSR